MTLLILLSLCDQTQTAATVKLEVNLTGKADYGYSSDTLLPLYWVPNRGYHLTNFSYKRSADLK